MFVRTMAAALAATMPIGLTIASPASAQQVPTKVKQVGQWSIESIMEAGKFHSCRARGASPNGDINILQRAPGNWDMTIPPLDLPPGTRQSGMMELGRASIPFTFTAAAKGWRPSITLNNDLLEGLRSGGYIKLTAGGKSFAMQMDNTAAAIGAVSDCRNVMLKSGGGQATNNAGGGKEVFNTVKTVGPWTIQTVHKDGMFLRCRAAMTVAGDQIAIVRYPDKWNLSFPNKGWTTGMLLNGTLAFNGSVTQIKNRKAVTNERPSIFVNDAMLRQLRGGGDMVVKLNGQTFNWHIGVAGETVGAVEDCRRANI